MTDEEIKELAQRAGFHQPLSDQYERWWNEMIPKFRWMLKQRDSDTLTKLNDVIALLDKIYKKEKDA